MARCAPEGETVRGAVTAIAPDRWGRVSPSPGIRCDGSPVASTFKEQEGLETYAGLSLVGSGQAMTQWPLTPQL